jgi:hypothetical protein
MEAQSSGYYSVVFLNTIKITITLKESQILVALAMEVHLFPSRTQ